MEAQVLFRVDQHAKATDFANSQNFVRAAADHIVNDAIDDGKKYYGLLVAKTGPTETTMAVGRLYSSGAIFKRETQTVVSHISKLPSVTQRIATVVIWGLDQEEAIEPRAFVVDANANPPIFEPREVTMRSVRALQADVIYGPESAAPQRGVIDSGVLPVCDILLDTTGVVSVTMVEENRLKSLKEEQGEIDELNDWRADVGQQIDTLRSDMSRIEGKIPPDWRAFAAATAAKLDQIWNLLQQLIASQAPTMVKSFIDRFRNNVDSDVAHATYSAKVEDGLTFPSVTSTRIQISLLNPLEPKCRIVDDICLPNWTGIPRLRCIDRHTFCVITSFPVVTVGCEHLELARRSIRHGDLYTSVDAPMPGGNCFDTMNCQSFVEDQGSPAGLAEISRRPEWPYLFCQRDDGEPNECSVENFCKFDDLTSLISRRGNRVCVDEIMQPYTTIALTTSSIQGGCKCQTYLHPSSGWCGAIKLFFRDRASAGDCHVRICELKGDLPDETACIATATLLFADIHTREEGCRVPLPPCFLESGRRYGIIVVSQGNHSFWHGSSFSKSLGHHYYRNSTGVWVSSGYFEMNFEIEMCQFEQNRCEVQLTSVQLTGGIAAIRAMCSSHVPQGCRLGFEVQNGGIWMPIDDDNLDCLVGLPTLLPIRVVFHGTRDLMPCMRLVVSEVECMRTLNAFTHFSKEHDFGVEIDELKVEYSISRWRSTHHTLDCRLIIGGSTSAAAGAITYNPDPCDPTKTRKIFHWTGLGEQVIDSIKTVGGVDNVNNGFFTVNERADHGFA